MIRSNGYYFVRKSEYHEYPIEKVLVSYGNEIFKKTGNQTQNKGTLNMETIIETIDNGTLTNKR